jgi:hypothetical protein
MKDEFEIGMKLGWPSDVGLGIADHVTHAIKDIETSMVDGFSYSDGYKLLSILKKLAQGFA